jgi:hypothetical protein
VKRSTIATAGLLAVLGLSLTACGDDSGGDDEASGEAAGVTTTTADPGLGTELCDSITALGVVFESGPDGPPTPEFLQGEVLPAVDDVITAATDEDAVLGPALEVQGLLEGDDVDPDAVLATYNDMLAPTHDDCGNTPVDVTAVDYEFDDVPPSIPAGPVSIGLTNEGTEQHEMIVFRKADGETRTAEELLALPEAEFGEAATFTAAAVVEPGATGFANADFEAGDYVAFCFLPVGGAENAPPHFTRGMFTEFEVS